MKNNWLTLYGDTFLWLKDNTGLIYNAANKAKLIFHLSDKIEIICHQFLEINNLYTIELTEEAIRDDEINQWIHSLISIQAGYLSLHIEFDKRPVSLSPILKVQDDKEYYEEQHKLGFKGKILQNIHELTFYINGSQYGNDECFKQTIYPVKSRYILNSSTICSFIKNSRTIFLSNINLVGNLFSYSDSERLISYISNLSVQTTIYMLINDFLNNVQEIKEREWPTNIHFNLLINTVFDISCLQNISTPFFVTIFVFSEDEFMQFSSMFETFYAVKNIRYIPLYNKSNLSFFESNVFMGKNDMDKIELSKNEIFMRQAFNAEDFGKLTVMPDGNVYANVNALPLGTIDDSPYSIVYKEFTNGESWFKLRDQAPCNNCIYQWLCPSPSNYEIVIERPNLCHVKT